jgi:hypothetical protein
MTRLAALLLLVATSCSSSSPAPRDAAAEAPRSEARAPEALAPVDWALALDASRSRRLPRALLGHYDLSGALFSYAKVPGLITSVRKAGLSEWRVGLGRWELATRLLPTLSDGSSCAAALALFPPQAFAPAGASDLELVKERDWFSDDGKPVTASELADSSRYRLDYLRGVLDAVAAFGAEPYVSVDLMPRALSVNRTFARVAGPIANPCEATFTNAVSNARPADAAIFAKALVELVRRVVEGEPGAAPRPVRTWEIWNEPELAFFWDKSFESKGLDRFFEMAVHCLTALDAYRASSSHANAKAIRLSLGSFAFASTAKTVIESFDPLPARPPLDVIAFHAYATDPLAVVAEIESVTKARAASQHYQKLELALAEWGPALGDASWDRSSMSPALHAATVLTLGAALGLDRAHRAILWSFYPAIPWGLVDHDGSELPVLHAYALLAALYGGEQDAEQLEVGGAPLGRLGSDAAVLAARGSDGKLRALLVNRGANARLARLSVGGAAVQPARLTILEDPKQPPRSRAVTGDRIAVPARALVLVEL